MIATPLEIDGVAISSAAGVQELASRALEGALGALPTDGGPFDGIIRVWAALEATPWAEVFSQEMASGLANSRQREAALFFFGIAPRAPGGEALLALVESARAGTDALAPGELQKALEALGGRMIAGDSAALSFGRGDALGAGGPEAYIAALTCADPDWVIAHAEAIVERHPEAGLAILFNLQEAGYDPVPTGIAIAPHARRSSTFKKNLARFIDDAAPIRQAMRRSPTPR